MSCTTKSLVCNDLLHNSSVDSIDLCDISLWMSTSSHRLKSDLWFLSAICQLWERHCLLQERSHKEIKLIFAVSPTTCHCGTYYVSYLSRDIILCFNQKYGMMFHLIEIKFTSVFFSKNMRHLHHNNLFVDDDFDFLRLRFCVERKVCSKSWFEDEYEVVSRHVIHNHHDDETAAT